MTCPPNEGFGLWYSLPLFFGTALYVVVACVRIAMLLTTTPHQSEAA